MNGFMTRKISLIFFLLTAPFLRAAEFEIERVPDAVEKESPFLNPDYLITRVNTDDSSRGKQIPLVIFLHGAGGRGTDVEKIKRNATPALTGAEKWAGEPFLFVAPQAGPPTKEVEVTWIPEELDRWLAHLKETQPIDDSRIYLTGVSMGGFGTWAWAANSPEHFAALVPIVGGLGFGGPKDITPDLDQWAENLSAIPAWCFHGAKDEVVPADRSEQMIELIRKKGGRQARLTIYPEEGHGAAGRVYATEDMYRWMFAQQREGRAAVLED